MSVERPAWSDDDVEAFRELAHTFLVKECLPHEDAWREQHHPDRAAWTRAGELGLLCPSVPEQFGGGGGTFALDAAMTEEQMRTGSGALATPVHSGIVAPYILEYGTEEQRQRWLPKLASGEFVGAIAMTEPGTGSDLQSVRTRARKDGESYVLDGSKTFITNGYHADLVIVVAKTDPERGAKGISLLVVETAQTPGFSRGRLLKKIGQHSQDTAELFFDSARIPADNLLGGKEGQGFVQLMQQLPQERLLIGVMAAAAIERAVTLTVDYTKDRKAFGKPLFDFQNTKFKLAEMATTATVARAFIDDCITKHLNGGLDAATASMAKWWLTQMQCDVVDECVQFFGGYGYMDEYPIARMYADSRVQKIYGGSNEIMKELISRFL